MDECAIQKGQLVKLRSDLDEASLSPLADICILPGIAYRVLLVEPGNKAVEHESEDLIWIGENKFSPKEIDAFDPVVSLDDDHIKIYDDVVPIGASLIVRLFD